MRDFSSKTLRALKAHGVSVIGTCVIPTSGEFAFANGSRGYRVDDNGCGRIWTFAQVMEAAK